MTVDELAKLGRGAVIALDRKVGEAIDIYVNSCMVARDEVVVVDDRWALPWQKSLKSTEAEQATRKRAMV